MRKHFLIMLLLVAMNGSSQSVKGLYVNDFASILGNTQAEDSLLNYADVNGFNYLALYELHIVHAQYDMTSIPASAPLAAFILKAKTQYGIQEVGAIAENFWFFSNRVNVYNQLHPNADEQFDVFNLEFEFWLTSATGPSGYYCTTYLQPNGYSCDTSGAFDFYINELRMIDSLAAINSKKSETYVGWPTASQAHSIAAIVDRTLIHAYVTNPATSYSYTQTRLSYFAGSAAAPDVMIIFSSEPSFMGPWLNSNPEALAYTTWYNGFANETAAWTSNINIVGYQWFAYTFMTYDLSLGVSDALFPYTIMNSGTALEITCPHSGVRTFSIHDVNGRVISTSTSSSAQHSISVTALSAGMYVLSVTENARTHRTTFAVPQ